MIVDNLFLIPNGVINWVQLKMYSTVFNGGKVKINGRIYRRGKGTLYIGRNVTINSSKWSSFLGGSSYTTICVYSGATIEISDGVGISNATLIARQRIVIEKNSMIGANVKLYDNDFHSLAAVDRIAKINDVPASKEIVVKEGAFIGAHSIVLKGVTIGKNSVIGAGSVVTKSVPDGEVWAGNPAKFIKRL